MFVSGDSRTGKSFLANYLMGQLNGFPLGAAVEVSNDLLSYTYYTYLHGSKFDFKFTYYF